jgi:hypothetical protein
MFSCRTIRNEYNIAPITYPEQYKNVVGKETIIEDRSLFILYTLYACVPTTYIEADMSLEKPYKYLFIKELFFEIDNEKIFILKNVRKKLGKLWQWQATGAEYKVIYSPDIDFDYFKIGQLTTRKKEKLFKWISNKDENTIKITQVYSFDDEPLKTESYEYTVTAFKEEYLTPWVLDFGRFAP